jgi:O-antigen biosynthesis protein
MRGLIALDDQLSSKRYEPPPIDLGNKNSSQTLSIDLIGSHKKILEIGTSTGYVSKILKEQGNIVTGIEIDQEAGSIAEKYCDRLIFGDAEELDFDTYFSPQSYDIILCGDILEHLKSPSAFLKKVKKYLKSDGYLVVSLPNFCHGDVLLNILNGDFHYTSKGLLDETHLHFFGLKNIYSLFAECGYGIKNIHTTNLGIGETELKIDLEKIPPNLLKFIRSLPNSSVYQFIFTAYPSANVIFSLPFTEPEINKLVFDSCEESVREIKSALSQAIEKNQVIEPELARLHHELILKDNHINNLDAIIHAKDTQILAIEPELARLHHELILKDNHNNDLDAIIQKKDTQIQAIEPELARLHRELILKDNHNNDLDAIIQKKEMQYCVLSENYLTTVNEIDRLNKEIEDKQRHIVNIEEELRTGKMSIFKKIFNKYFFTLQKYSPVGTKRRQLLELFDGAATLYSSEGFLCLSFRIKARLEDSLFLKGQRSKLPIISIKIDNYPDNLPFSLEQELLGQFTCPTDHFNEIRIFTATYCRKNRDLIFQLKDCRTEKIERIVTVKGYTIFNNNWTHIRFAPIQNSKNRTFQFRIKSLGSPAAAIWLNSKYKNSELQLFDENGSIPGFIGFQCFSTIKIQDPYSLWIINHEPTQNQLEQLKKNVQSFSYRPKISIITPVWNTDEKWLRLSIESVINQAYDNWELCLVDGGSTKPHIKRVLDEYAQKDPRIKVKILPKNKGIAGNSNEALAFATGDFVGFLDHDDELVPFTLFEVVKLLNQKRNMQFIYSDEDKIDQNGTRKDPFFKPDWSPDLFLSQNYLCHFSVIHKALIDSVGGFHPGYDGSQDYDLFLRCTEKISPIYIAHIPKILYHWRMIPGSAADQVGAKPYAIISAKKALVDALTRRDLTGKVEDGIFPSSYRIHYEIQDNPCVSIIIPTKDRSDILKQCIQSILKKTEYQNYKIIIVDNQSSDEKTIEYYALLERNPKIKILHYDKPFNFSAINNYAGTHVDSPYLLFLNNDTEVISGEWLSAMLEHAQRGCVGAVGAKLLYPNNLIQHAGVILGITGTPGQKGVAGHSHKKLPDNFTGHFLRPQIIGNYSAVTAACLMMRKDVFKEIGGFNEDLAIAFNDVDLCLKIRSAGYLIVYTPYSRVYHHESISRGYEDTLEKQIRFSREVTLLREQWGAVIDKGDPYYNPNISLEKEDFSINNKWRDKE